MPSTSIATERAKRAASQFTLPSTHQLFQNYRKSITPEGGWTNENFTGSARKALRQDMLMARRAVLLRGMRYLAPSLAKVMREQVEGVVDSALNAFSRLYGIPIKAFAYETKDSVEFTVPNRATMWAEAIEQEMARAGSVVELTMAPAVTSVAVDTLEKTNLLLGLRPPDNRQLAGLNIRIRRIAAQITNINKTTKRSLQDTIAKSIREGKTIFETAQIVRDRIPQIATNRVPTIVRTEMGRAVDEATRYAMKESNTVTHFDVIGCEAIEPDIPTYKGVPTCNIKGVPIQDEGLIRFHPNHTGAIVVAAFYQSDGSIPTIPLTEGLGDGTPEGG